MQEEHRSLFKYNVAPIGKIFAGLDALGLHKNQTEYHELSGTLYFVY
jgi:hypothetical protein